MNAGWLMVGVWAIYTALFFFGPIEFLKPPSAESWAEAAISILVFLVASGAGRFVPIAAHRRVPTDRRIGRVIVWMSIAGAVGIAALAIDKVLLSGLDYFSGITAVRYQRDLEVASGIEVARSPLLYFGYLTFSFSYCSVLLFFISAEAIGRTARLLGELSAISPIGYALLYGGRAPVLILILLITGAAIARKLAGRPLVPRVMHLRLQLSILLIGFYAYTSNTWESRRSYSAVSQYSVFLDKVAKDSWKIAPKPWLSNAVDTGILSDASALNVVSNFMYLTHGMTAFDKMIGNIDEFEAYYGVYQIGVLSPIIRQVAPLSTLVDRMTWALQRTDAFGWFPTAWGAWLMDVGPIFRWPAIALWGFVSGHNWRRVRLGGNPADQLMLSFWVGSILISPINAPFGMANSALIYLSLVLAATMLRGTGSARLRMQAAPQSAG